MFHFRSLIGFILLLFVALPPAQAQRWKRTPNGRLIYTEFTRPLSTTTTLVSASELPISPVEFGAVGDGDTLNVLTGTDNTTAVQAAMTAAGPSRTVKFPEGIFKINGTLIPPGPLTLELSPRTVLFFTSVTTNFFQSGYGIDLNGNGGMIRGNYSMSGQGTPGVVAGRNWNNRLISINIPAGRYVPMISIRNTVFRRAAGMTVEISQQGASVAQPRLGGVEVDNCTFSNTYGGLLINNFSDDLWQKNIAIRRTKFLNTASTGGFFDQAYEAGNGLTIWGLTDGLIIDECKFLNLGRMAWEFFVGGQQLQGMYPTNTKITRCKVENANYFNCSLAAKGLLIAECEFIANHPNYLEATGNDHTYYRNILRGSSINTTSNLPSDPYSRRGLRIIENELYDMVGQKDMIGVFHAKDVVVRGNKLYVYNDQRGTGQRNPLSVQYSTNAEVDNNTITTRLPFASALWNLSNNVNLRWTNDKGYLENYTDDQLEALLFYSGNYRSSASNIRMFSTGAVRLKFEHFQGHNYTPQALFIREKTAGGWTIAPLASLNPESTPPSSATVGQTYLLRDGATGAWSGQPRKLAQWTGSGWRFTPVAGAYLYLANPGSSPIGTDNELPVDAPTGTTQLLYTGVVWSKVDFHDCDFSAGGLITRPGGSSTPALGNAVLFGVTLDRTAVSLNDTKISDATSQTVNTERILSDMATANNNSTLSARVDAMSLTVGQQATQITTNTNGVTSLLSLVQTSTAVSGKNSTFYGLFTGNTTGTGTDNTFLGRTVGLVYTTGSRNVLIGAGVGNILTTASNGVYIGHNTGTAITTGGDNIFIGQNVGNSTSTASENLALGRSAFNNTPNPQSSQAIGQGTAANLTGATMTLFLGHTTGTPASATGVSYVRSTLLGPEAGRNVQSGAVFTRIVALGNDALNGASSLSDVILGPVASTWLVGTNVKNGSTKLQVTGGAGIDNVRTDKLTLTLLSGAAPPTTTQLPTSGDMILWSNTTDNTLKLYVNQGGTIKAISFN